MFCIKCGSQLENGVKFCTRCGTATLVKREEPPKTQSGKTQKKSRKNFGAAFAVILVVLALCAGALGAAGMLMKDNHDPVRGEDTNESTDRVAEEETETVYYVADTMLQTQICGDDFLNVDQQGRKEIAENVLYELEEQGELKEGTITYSEEREVFYFCYPDGAEGAIMLNDFSAELLGGSSLDFEVEYTPYTSALYDGISEELAENGLEIIYGKRSGIIINCLGDENEQEVIAKDDNGADITQKLFLEYEAEAWTANGLETEYVRNCTVEDFKTILKDKGFIDIRCHGFIASDGNPTICLQENFDKREYVEDRKNGRVGVVHSESGKFYYLTDDFIRYYYSDKLNESIVWLGCCDGYTNNTLVSAFAECGAKAVLGATESVLTAYNALMTDAFVYWLLYGYTVDESLTLAKDAYGRNDRVFYSKKPGKATAEIRYYNGGEETLVVLGYAVTTGKTSIIVTDEYGNRLQSAEVLLDDNKGSGNTVYHYWGETDDDGVFSVPSCEAGWYTLSVTLEGYDIYEGEIQVERNNTTELVVILKSEQVGFSAKLSELISEYGIFDANQSGTMRESDDEWLEPTGVMSATILDFDLDGSDEMLVCVAEAAEDCENSYSGSDDAYHIVMYMYENDEGEVKQTDSMVLAAYKETEEYGIEYVDVDLWKNYWTTGAISISAVLVHDTYYFFCENYSVYSAFADGFHRDYWVLEYADGVLQYAGSFAQMGESSEGFAFEGYSFEDGICVSSDTYYNYWWNCGWSSVAALYRDLDEAITAFFGEYGIRIDSEGVYNPQTILSSENNVIAVLEFQNKMTEYDYDNHIHYFSVTLSRGNDFTGELNENKQNDDEETEAKTEVEAEEYIYDGTIDMYFKGTWIKDDMVYIFTPNSNIFSVSYSGGIGAASGDLVILDIKKKDATYGSYMILNSNQINLIYSLSEHVVSYVYTGSSLMLDGNTYTLVDDAVVHQLEGEWIGDDITIKFHDGSFEKSESGKKKETGSYYVISEDTIIVHINGNTSMSVWSYSLDHLTMIYNKDTVLTKDGNDSSVEKVHEIEEQLYGTWTGEIKEYCFYKNNICVYENVFVYTYRVLDEKTVCIYTQPPEEFAYTILTYDEKAHTLTDEYSWTSSGDNPVLYQK